MTNKALAKLRTATDKKLGRDIQKRIRSERQRLGLTQGDLAKILRKSQGSISNIEKGTTEPSFVDLCYLALHFGKPLQWFLDGRIQISESADPNIGELAAYGIDDLRVTHLDLPVGAFRSAEEVLCRSLVRPISPRVVEALPVLVLRNKLRSEILMGFARHYQVVLETALICDVAKGLNKSAPWLDSSLVEFDGVAVERFLDAAWIYKSELPKTPRHDSIVDHIYWKRWGARVEVTFDEFELRTRSIMRVEVRE